MQQKIKKGALARLISGGPVMTVQAISTSGDTALCAWFDGAALTCENFAIAGLVHVDGAEGLQSPAPLLDRSSRPALLQ